MSVTNAVLTAINEPGTPDRYAKVSADGDEVWSGRQSAYLKRASKMETVGGNMTKREFDQLIVYGRLPAPVTEGSELRGSTIVVTDNRDSTPVERRFRVVGVEKLSVGSAVDSVRLELSQEQSA